jgi:hypothetical protein
MARHPSEHWPEPGSEFWVGFMAMLVTNGVWEDEAEEASILMMAEPQIFPGNHLPKLLEHVRAIWKERPRETPDGRAAPISDRDQAARESADCPECGGVGFSERYKHHGAQWCVRAASGAEAWLDRITVACDCALGQFFAASNTEGGECRLPTLTPEIRRVSESRPARADREIAENPESTERALANFEGLLAIFSRRERPQDIVTPTGRPKGASADVPY